MDLLKARMQESEGWKGATDIGFAGLPFGIPLLIGLPMKIAEQFTGINLDELTSLWTDNPIVSNLTNVAQTVFSKIFAVSANLQSLFGSLNFLDPDFDIGDALTAWVNFFVGETGLLPLLTGGLISGANIPGLDASKIVTGFFSASRVLNLPGLFTDVTAGFQNLFNGWFGGTAATGTPADTTYVIESVKQAVINGYTVDTFTTNDNWVVPANLVECHFIMIGGGGRGETPATVSGAGSAIRSIGGTDGGYLAVEIDPATLTAGALVPVVIGMGATTPGAEGGLTSVGSVYSTPGVGSLSTVQGFVLSTSKPGRGGNGGSQATGQKDGLDGESSATGTGGAGSVSSVGTGAGTAGGNGETVSLIDEPKCGGGGGGGGGSRTGGTSPFGGETIIGGAGGAGGYPGGGSGAGGNAQTGGSFNVGQGGAGGTTPNGAAFIKYKTG